MKRTEHPVEVFFVTGAPRSGTTFLSDLVTQSPFAYCCHEVLPELVGKSNDEILEYLQFCAATGVDRLAKPLQREFIRWVDLPCKRSPNLLGLKEPLVWFDGLLPEPIGQFLMRFDTRYIVTIRHPYDVIASGKHRARYTRNWPNFTIEAHARFWERAVDLSDWLAVNKRKLLLVRWERLVLDFDGTRRAIGQFLGVDLPRFYGYEHTPDHFHDLCNNLSLAEGVKNNPYRDLLTHAERLIIRTRLRECCKDLGYEL